MVKLRKVLCWFGFHNLTHYNEMILKSEKVRVVVFYCPHCDEYSVKTFQLGTKPSPGCRIPGLSSK